MEMKDRLVQLRKKKNMTQADLAEALNVSRQAVSRWETGVSLPSTENLIELSKLYEVGVDVILGRERTEETEKRDETENSIVQGHQRKQGKKRALATVLILTIVAILIICSVIIFSKTAPVFAWQ